MARGGKAQKKSSMRGKRGLHNSRAIGARESGKKVAGGAGRLQEGPERTRPTGAEAGRTRKVTRRPRKSDI